MTCAVCQTAEATTSATVDRKTLECCESCKLEVDRTFNAGKWYIAQWKETKQLMFAGSRLECERFAAGYKKRDQREIEILAGGQ